MFDDAARAVLQQKLIARLSVNGLDGYPHVVPVWFYLDGDDIVFISVRGTHKIRLLEADPRAAVTVGGDDGAGYLIKGDMLIEDDPDDAWVRRLTYHYEEPEQAAKDVADWADLDIVVLRLKPKVVLKVA